MSKEELLKYLIAEIDLIMHDKDYRFENANGTWYSRESCRDLTNEEVFEYAKNQISDLEAKLAEKEKEIESLKDNWNVLCDYLGDCVVKYDEEDVNGIYGEVLDKVNILKRYDYKRYQDKISFALEQLEKVKKEMDLRPRGVSKGWKNKEYDTLVEEDVYEVIDNQIASLKKEME